MWGRGPALYKQNYLKKKILSAADDYSSEWLANSTKNKSVPIYCALIVCSLKVND
jgi:hypothetical protein